MTGPRIYRGRALPALAIIPMACVIGLASSNATAQVLATTDFGLAATAPNANVAPFSTDYTANVGPPGPTTAGEYEVHTTGRSFAPWGGVDNTTGVDNFMVINGSLDSNDAVLSFTTATVDGGEYTFSGFAQNVDGGAGPAVLSFRVDGVEQATFAVADSQTWSAFSFSFTETADGTRTFSIHDNNTADPNNNFGLDDVMLEAVLPPTPPSPSAPAEPIPTMSLYGLGLSVLGLLIVGARRLRSSGKRSELK